MLKKVAFIPARSGSKRIIDKNIRRLNGHPLIAYSIQSALDSGIFDSVICATDSERYADIASYYGAEIPLLRPLDISGEKSSDIEWVTWILDYLKSKQREYDVFSILRPTSPFRKGETIQRAWKQFSEAVGVDSLRAIELCKQHPGKMWIVNGSRMTPLLPMSTLNQPFHSTQYAALPQVYVQNASLEMAWTKVVTDHHTIAGNVIMPFLTSEEEGLDVNEEFDWWRAERLLEGNNAALPLIKKQPWNK